MSDEHDPMKLAKVTSERMAGVVIDTLSQFGRRPDFYRLLNQPERDLAIRVFGQSLPPWEQIGIGNGIGAFGRPWTYHGFYITGVGYPQTPSVRYAINMGSVASENLTSARQTIVLLKGDYGRFSDLFIHEMTHVWQYAQGIAVARKSFTSQCFGAGYEYDWGESWDDYNVEQQAHMVENWHKRGMSKKDQLYPYIRCVVQAMRIGRTDMNRYAAGLDIQELNDTLSELRRRGLD
jgi:hypothetical protein